jgi:hypothetical protein
MRLIVAASFLLALGSTAEAASAVLHGVRLSCKAARAVHVVPYVSGYAAADIEKRIIYLGRSNLAGMQPSELRYIMNHECGHLLRGPDEYLADAYANRTLKPSGRLCSITGRCSSGRIAGSSGQSTGSTAALRAGQR